MTPERRPVCAVTGASGYVGSRIAAYLARNGADVIELNRGGSPSLPGSRAMRFTLGDDPPAGVLRGVDVLVHCAYDFSVNDWASIERVNVQGSSKLLRRAYGDGVATIIAISTVSAFEGCRSLYGRAKLLIEREARGVGGYIVRPGLVYDDQAPRGMVGALAGLLQVAPVVPLIGGGKQVLYPCHADDLARLIYILASQRPPVRKSIVAATHEGLTFRQILEGIARSRGKHRLFVPVPYSLVLGALRAAEAVGIRTRLRSDSLVSLMNQDPAIDFSGLDATGAVFRGIGPNGLMPVVR